MYDPAERAPIGEGERVLARFQPDKRTYVQSQVTLAVLSGVLAVVALMLVGNASPWVGIVAAFLGIGVRAVYLMSEELSASWTLTDAALYGPGGRQILLGNVARVRRIGSAVQVVTQKGDKHLVKFVPDPGAVQAQIETVASGRG